MGFYERYELSIILKINKRYLKSYYYILLMNRIKARDNINKLSKEVIKRLENEINELDSISSVSDFDKKITRITHS